MGGGGGGGGNEKMYGYSIDQHPVTGMLKSI